MFSVGLEDDNIFKWNITLFGSAGTCYEGGMFNATMEFPQDYPYSPPTFKFITKMWHPNIYESGVVCISILHKAGSDPTDYERPEDCWSPVRSIESVLLSIHSMLDSPNLDSPANVDAAVMLRNEKTTYRRTVQRYMEMSLG